MAPATSASLWPKRGVWGVGAIAGAMRSASQRSSSTRSSTSSSLVAIASPAVAIPRGVATASATGMATLAPSRVPITAPFRVPITAPSRVSITALSRVPITAPFRVPSTAPARVPTKASSSVAIASGDGCSASVCAAVVVSTPVEREAVGSLEGLGLPQRSSPKRGSEGTLCITFSMENENRVRLGAMRCSLAPFDIEEASERPSERLSGSWSSTWCVRALTLLVT